MNGRLLTPLETVLSEFCGSEAQGVLLAKHISLPLNPTEKQIADAVMLALVRVRESAQGKTEIHYVSGQRRDLLRDKSK